jgi:hypothetical protein
MNDEVRWNNVEYVSRVDVLADDVPDFVDAVLESIDYDAARASERSWEIVQQFFGGCAAAARLQHSGTGIGAKQIAAYFHSTFQWTDDEKKGMNRPSPEMDEGFAEFMDWMSDPENFEPRRLREILERRR